MTNSGLRRWHEVVATRDAGALHDVLHEDVVFHSPVVHTPQRGRQLTELYLTAALGVLGNEHFRYVREVADGSCAVLEFETEIDGVTLNGIDFIEFDDAGLIVDFKVMIRPKKAFDLVHGLMRATLESMKK